MPWIHSSGKQSDFSPDWHGSSIGGPDWTWHEPPKTAPAASNPLPFDSPGYSGVSSSNASASTTNATSYGTISISWRSKRALFCGFIGGYLLGVLPFALSGLFNYSSYVNTVGLEVGLYGAGLFLAISQFRKGRVAAPIVVMLLFCGLVHFFMQPIPFFRLYRHLLHM